MARKVKGMTEPRRRADFVTGVGVWTPNFGAAKACCFWYPTHGRRGWMKYCLNLWHSSATVNEITNEWMFIAMYHGQNDEGAIALPWSWIYIRKSAQVERNRCKLELSTLNRFCLFLRVQTRIVRPVYRVSFLHILIRLQSTCTERKQRVAQLFTAAIASSVRNFSPSSKASQQRSSRLVHVIHVIVVSVVASTLHR